MSLGAVSRALGINDATLRQWADRGRLPVYRTPGGHRRFLREDVEALVRERSNGHANSATTAPVDSEDQALQRIRRRLGQIDLSQQSWMESFRAEGRDRMRLFGRRLLSLLLQNRFNGSGRRRGETLSETHMLGHEYGSEMALRGVPLTDSVQAFLFFRQAVVDTPTNTTPGRWWSGRSLAKAHTASLMPVGASPRSDSLRSTRSDSTS